MRCGTRSIANQHRAVGQQPAEVVFAFDRYGADAVAFHSVDAIVSRERLVEHGEIGVYQLGDTGIAPDKLGDEGDGFINHVVANRRDVRPFGAGAFARFDVIQESGKQITVDRHRFHFCQTEPLIREVRNKIV